jgi:excinuclease UvrABC nuclease subunit
MKIESLVNFKLVEKMQFTPFDKEVRDIGAGVYRLYDKAKQIIYIGKSADLFTRLSDHLSGKAHTKYFSKKVKYCDWYSEPSPINRSVLEAVLISYFEPKHNIEVKREASQHKRKAKKERS